MTAPGPIVCVYDDEGRFVPAGPHWAKKAAEHYYIGERYQVEVREQRSQRSHNHFFAVIADAWANLPEDLAEEFGSPEHLRAWALIRAGYRNERRFVCDSQAEAERFAAFLRPIDEFKVIVAREGVVLELTAQSQSQKAMGKRVFQQSKDRVLDVISQLVGRSVDDLKRNAREVAT